MLAYHGRQDLKDAVLAGLAEHRRLDQIAHVGYWKDGRGCAVGCTLDTLRRIEGLDVIEHGDHALYERYMGVPIMLARLEDTLFERLPVALSLDWPARFSAAIRPGADLSMVWPKFLLNLLSDPHGAVQGQCARLPRIAASVQGVMDLYERWIAGAKPSDAEWREARAAAYAASDAAAAAASAAYAASDAAAATASDASDAYDDAAAAERVRQADALIALLEAASVARESRCAMSEPKDRRLKWAIVDVEEGRSVARAPTKKDARVSAAFWNRLAHAANRYSVVLASRADASQEGKVCDE